MHRSWYTLTTKAVDDEKRVIVGVATTPEMDRVGDVVDPKGVQFKNPLPLLMHHDARMPVGLARLKKATADGIEFEARLADPGNSLELQDRVELAWASIKAGLLKGISIGFRALDDGIELLQGGGFRFVKSEVLELSLVCIPANAGAVITSIKSFDAQHLAAHPGDGASTHPHAHRPGTPVVKVLPSRQEHAMKSLADQIASYKSTRDQKFTERQGLMTKAAEDGVTLNAEQSDQYDTLDGEIKQLDIHVKRLEDLQSQQAAAAQPVQQQAAAVQSVAQRHDTPVIHVKDNLPPGIGFARSVMAKVVARLDHRYVVDVAKEMFPNDQRLHSYFVQKANVTAGNTLNSLWAGALVDQTNLTSEFIEYLRPSTIIGKFGANGIPSLRNVPFNVRVVGQTTGGSAYWVGEGKPKPVTAFEFQPTTLLYTKVAAIAVITQELARFSTPSAESLVRDALRDAIVERLDIDFIDPAQAAVANVNPASITNGLTALSSAGTSADNVRTDIQNLLEGFLAANQRVGNLVLIMPETLALALSMLVNDLGQREFPDVSITGGRLLGIPVITSQYAANASGSGNLVIAVNASEIFLADDGQVTVDMSTEASLQMLDNPTNDVVTPTPTTMVSLWQTNSIGLRAERFINWAKRRSTAVVYMDDVNWGAIGSPA